MKSTRLNHDYRDDLEKKTAEFLAEKIKREMNKISHYLFMTIFSRIFILGYNLSDNSAGVLYNDTADLASER